MIIELPKYQRTITTPQLQRTAVPRGYEQLGRAQYGVLQSLSGLAEAAGQIYVERRRAIGDQVISASTLYKDVVTRGVKDIEENPTRKAMGGGDNITDPYGIGFEYSNSNRYRELRIKAEEEAMKLVKSPEAREMLRPMMEELDALYMEGIRSFDKQKNDEMQLQRLMKGIELNVANKDQSGLASNISMALFSGIINDRGTANDILAAGSQQIGAGRAKDTFRQIAQARGLGTAMDLINNPEKAGDLLWYDQMGIGEDGDFVTKKSQLPAEAIEDIKTTIAADDQDRKRILKEQVTALNEQIKTDGLDKIYTGEIRTRSELTAYIDAMDSLSEERTGLKIGSGTRSSLYNALDEESSRGEDYREDAVRANMYKLLSDNYLQGDAYIRAIDRVPGASEKLKAEFKAKLSQKFQNLPYYIQQEFDRFEQARKTAMDEADDEAEKALVASYYARTQSQLYQKIYDLKEDYTRNGRLDERGLEEAVTKYFRSDPGGMTALETAEKINSASIRGSILSKKLHELIGTVSPIGIGSGEAAAIAWGTLRERTGDWLSYHAPQIEVLDSYDAPTANNNLPIFLIRDEELFGDSVERWASLDYDDSAGDYVLKVQTDGYVLDENGRKVGTDQWRTIPIPRKKRENLTADDFRFSKDESGEMKYVDYSELPPHMKTLIDNQLVVAREFNNYNYWEETVQVGRESVEIPPLEKILNIPLDMLPLKERNRRAAEAHAGYRR